METEPIRILHVVARMQLAGTETLIMSYYKKMDKRRIQFDFAVSATEECAYDKDIKALGGRIFRYPLYKVSNHLEYTKWWKEHFSNHPEHQIVHGHQGSTAAIYLRIAKRYGRVAIAHSHSTWGAGSFHEFVYRLYSYPTRYVADYFFGCSRQALVDRYGRRVAANPAIASVMSNAIDARRFVFNPSTRAAVRGEFGITEEQLVIGTVGRFSPPKNPLFMVALVAELAHRGVPMRFLWFGQGEMENEIKAEIERLKVSRYITLAGTRKDIYNVLQAMDVFVFPSVWEGLGISCIEAQAAGLPTLCSESVPIDAKITDLFHYLPINDVTRWADEVVARKNTVRKDRFPEIEAAGYDISSAAAKLQDFYLTAVTESPK